MTIEHSPQPKSYEELVKEYTDLLEAGEISELTLDEWSEAAAMLDSDYQARLKEKYKAQRKEKRANRLGRFGLRKTQS